MEAKIVHTVVVSNSKRQILTIDSEWVYLYIPLQFEEAKLLGYTDLEGNPALRIEIKKEVKEK